MSLQSFVRIAIHTPVQGDFPATRVWELNWCIKEEDGSISGVQGVLGRCFINVESLSQRFL